MKQSRNIEAVTGFIPRYIYTAHAFLHVSHMLRSMPHVLLRTPRNLGVHLLLVSLGSA